MFISFDCPVLDGQNCATCFFFSSNYKTNKFAANRKCLEIIFSCSILRDDYLLGLRIQRSLVLGNHQAYVLALGTECMFSSLCPERMFSAPCPAERMFSVLGCERMFSTLCPERMFSVRGSERMFSALCLERMFSSLCLERMFSALCPERMFSRLGTERMYSALCPERMFSSFCPERMFSALGCACFLRFSPVANTGNFSLVHLLSTVF